MEDIVRIGNAQAFWGDNPEAPLELVRQEPHLDYLTLDYLAEVSLSIMAVQREKDPQAGYARDFISVVKALIPLWKNGAHVKVVTNAGGLDPVSCGKACAELLRRAECPLKVGVVSGDDVLDHIRNNAALCNMETGESIAGVRDRLVAANAYIGAQPIAKALKLGAHIVITGRAADPSLTVGPCMAHFGWDCQNYDKIAQATVAGHLIECGTQVTGGISTHWLDVGDPAFLGFPFIEMKQDGTFVVTKPAGTGGIVNVETVKEQLLYELGDPAHYLSPDATVSFLSLKLDQVGSNRVQLSGAKGSPPTGTYKVSATYRDGFRSDAMIGVFGRQAVRKARLCGNIILQRMEKGGFLLDKTRIECLGAGDMVPGVIQSTGEASNATQLECVLRICVADSRKEAVEFFSRQVASLVTSGPQGICGYVSGRPRIRPVFGYWPCLIDINLIEPTVEIL